MSELPNGWASVPLVEIAEVVMGQAPAGEHCNKDGNGLPFFQGKAEFRKLYPVARKFCSVPTKIAEKDDILLSIRAPVGPTNLAPEKCCIGRGLAGIRADSLGDQNYLLYFFKHIEPWLSQQGTGSTFKAISGDQVRCLVVSLAPKAEQTRIATKLDELLAQVDTLKARIDSIPALLKRFRQSVLAAAVSGQLTEEWRLKIASADQLDHSAYPEVPLDSLADFQNGFAFKSDWFSKTGDIQVAKIGNVRNGKVDLGNSPAFVSYEVGSEYQRFMTLEGDILLSMTGTKYKRDYGNACSAPAGILVNQRVGKLRPQRDKVDGRFLLLCLQTAGFREQFFSGETGQVSQGNVGSEHIKKCLIPSPAIEEQAEIVCRTAQLFAFAEQVEAKVVLAKSRVDHLAQSILAKAFRGELVPQDPNDEPASVLLERIKAKRTAMPKAKRGRQAAKLC